MVNERAAARQRERARARDRLSEKYTRVLHKTVTESIIYVLIFIILYYRHRVGVVENPIEKRRDALTHVRRRRDAGLTRT